jgi:hypothetical protein
MRVTSLIVVALIATGCATIQYSKVPERFSGKAFEVNKDINFPAGDYSVVFQKGQITRGLGITVWDVNCKLLMEKPQKESWKLSEGLYSITGFQRYSANCSRYDCMDIQEFSLQTVKGPVAEALTCRQQYNIGDGSPGPEPISADQLRITLGEYLRLKPAD